MTTARELWEQNRNDPSVKRLNDVLSKTSGSFAPASSQSARDEFVQPEANGDILFGMNPKRVQSLKAKLTGVKK